MNTPYKLLERSILFINWNVTSTNPIYQPLRSGRIWHQVNFFKRSLTGLNSEFSSSETNCLTKAEELSLSYYWILIMIIGFIPFPRVLVLCEMQSVFSRIWTRVAVSISYDDNHYTTDTTIVTSTNTQIQSGPWSNGIKVWPWTLEQKPHRWSFMSYPGYPPLF